MKYRIIGAECNSGSDIELFVDATNEDEALDIANRRQVLVARIEFVGEHVANPNTPGYVYALINASMPGLVKVGIATNSPSERASQLSIGTAVPSPFIVGYSAYFNDVQAAEDFVHNSLEEQGYRISDNREFFRAPLEHVIRAIHAFGPMASGDGLPIQDSKNESVVSIATLLVDVERLKSEDERKNALMIRSLLEEAIQRGSGEACSRLSDMYCDSGPFAEEDSAFQRVTLLRKQGASLGHAGCYSSLACSALIGIGDTLQDTDEAIHLYEQAAKLGSWEACHQLSQIFKYDTYGMMDLDRTLEWAKKGVDRGGDECYLTMAEVFWSSRNWLNAEKCFAMCFQSKSFKNGNLAHAVETYVVAASDCDTVPRRMDLVLASPLIARVKVIVSLDSSINSPLWENSPNTLESFRQIRAIIFQSMGENGAIEIEHEKASIRQKEEQLGYAEHGGMDKYIWDLVTGNIDPQDTK